MNNIEYIAFELDDASSFLLRAIAAKKVKELGWSNFKIICHHMTISHYTKFTDYILEWFKENQGKEYSATAIEIGQSDKALAVRLQTDIPSTNALKHITLAINKDNHGKAVDSNFITNWEKISPIELNGSVAAFFKH